MAARPNTLILAAGALLVLAACASDEQRYHDVGRGGFGRGGGGDARGPQRNLNLFISPAGKPYRAGPGDPYPVAAWFAAADLDHDGKLSRDEFRKDAVGFFHELDTDHDGVIDGFEQQAYEQKVAPEILPHVEGLAAGEGMDLSLGKGGRRDDGPDIGGTRRDGGKITAGDRQPQGAGLFGLLNEPEPVAATDTNFNGRITVEAFMAAADRRFDALDRARLGYLTLAALPKTPVQIALEQRAKRARTAVAASKP